MEKLTPSSFIRFYQAYHRRGFLYAKSYVLDKAIAEDIISEGLTKLWELSNEQEVENPHILLFTIVKNKALDYLKHQTIKESVLTHISESGKRELDIRISTLESSDPEKIFAKDVQDIIRKSLATLPEDTRRIFVLYRFKQVSKKEIADTYGISTKGVDYHISKATKILRKDLKDYYPLLFLLLS